MTSSHLHVYRKSVDSLNRNALLHRPFSKQYYIYLWLKLSTETDNHCNKYHAFHSISAVQQTVVFGSMLRYTITYCPAQKKWYEAGKSQLGRIVDAYCWACSSFWIFLSFLFIALRTWANWNRLMQSQTSWEKVSNEKGEQRERWTSGTEYTLTASCFSSSFRDSSRARSFFICIFVRTQGAWGHTAWRKSDHLSGRSGLILRLWRRRE